MSNFNSEPIDAADDPAFLEGDSEADEEMGKALLAELQRLVVQAQNLATA